MPVMDGLEATQSIRKKYDVMDRPRIVGVSASTMPEDIDLCMKSGMDSFFGKPIHIPDLITELKSCYNQKTNIQRKKAS